jgi:hypothetical protein
MLPIPPLSQDLLKALNERFPDRCPNPTDTEREIWMKAGERRLVEFLLTQKRQQDNNILTRLDRKD